MLTEEQAERLKDAGLDAYNHNLDTSRENYRSIITTRTYDDRLRTLRACARRASRCAPAASSAWARAIDDRCEMLRALANLEPQPESVPINALVPVEGTPLAALPPVDPLDLVRMIAGARILMPKAMVRLSAGRTELRARRSSCACYAGANSIFYGEKLLTTPNPEAKTKTSRSCAKRGSRRCPRLTELAPDATFVQSELAR